MEFNDRRPGNGQLSLFGGEVTADPAPQETPQAAQDAKPQRPVVTSYSPGNPTYDNNHTSPSRRLPIDLPPPVTAWDKPMPSEKRTKAKVTHYDSKGNFTHHSTTNVTTHVAR